MSILKTDDDDAIIIIGKDEMHIQRMVQIGNNICIETKLLAPHDILNIYKDNIDKLGEYL